jgi:hypothetical protein
MDKEHEMKELNEKGQVLIFVAAALVGLALFVGLAIDSGRAYLLKAQMARRVDPAALAAAAEYKFSSNLPAAQAAACNAALMNGLSCAGLTVTEEPVPEPDGSTTPGVRVTAKATMATSFMRLGKLIGCTTCDNMTVTASAVASPHSRVDLVMNLDDTGSMCDRPDGTRAQYPGNIPPGCAGLLNTRLFSAKLGAIALVDAMIPTICASTATKVSMVPFRGCYLSDPGLFPLPDQRFYCTDSDESPNNGGSIASLPAGITNNNTLLHGAINALTGAGGSGTNLCVGLTKARQKLFESPGIQSRPNAQRFLVLLTDAANNWDHLEVGNAAADPNPDCVFAVNSVAQKRVVSVNSNNLATQIKSPTANDPISGQQAVPVAQTVTIFVILYGSGTGAPTPTCDTNMIATALNPDTTTYWKNLATCIATDASHVMLVGDDPQKIRDAFGDIVRRLPVRLAQ